VTDDSPALHNYFEELGRLELFAKVDVGAVEHHSGDPPERIHFTVRLIVRPGYGQPNGPKPLTETVTSISNP
jgi:hypothetical protein